MCCTVALHCVYFVVLLPHIYCSSASYPVLFAIALCLLWSVKGQHMLISCVATIRLRASDGDIYVLTVHGPFKYREEE